MARRERRSRSFLPGDPRVAEPYRLTPQLALRVAVLAALALAVFAVLFLRLWALQVLSGANYLKQANQNRVRTLPIEAQRGLILDRNGRVLVRNTVGWSIELWPADLPKGTSERQSELTELGTVTGLTARQIQKKITEFGSDPLTPIVLRRGIHEDQISYFDEHQLDFPGVRLAQTYQRQYPHESLAAQLLGYVGDITPAELKEQKNKGVEPSDAIGQAGIESSYDAYLRGTDGSSQVTVDSLGQPTSQITPVVTSTPGNDLRLTIDLQVQRAAEKALKYGIDVARASNEPYADGGAIVAMDPRDGSVLAMASYPTYQPSIFVSRDPSKLAPLDNAADEERANYPGFNRAVDVGYPPGSTWKPVTALAAMEEHIISPTTQLLCSPSYTVAGQTFTNWDPNVDSYIDLPTALAESCDTYFYRVGNDFYALPTSTRGHPLQEWASRFGFGEYTGVDIPQASSAQGLVPTPEWRCVHYGGPPCKGYVDRIWKPGYSVQLAIGQGDLLVTPLQMARFYSVLANGGKLVTPHVVGDVEQQTNNPASPTILQRFAAQPPTTVIDDPAALRAVQEGLWEGTHSPIGTSSGVFGNFPVSIAGKTGTAQKLIQLPGYPNPLELNQSWWCGYGPTDSVATIAVCAVIENGGHGGTAAAPAALKVFESYFHKHPPTTTSHISD
ncbi:MAG TPA: penicillin-binding protein 2 [Gaiellaceae bacterium]